MINDNIKRFSTENLDANLEDYRLLSTEDNVLQDYDGTSGGRGGVNDFRRPYVDRNEYAVKGSGKKTAIGAGIGAAALGVIGGMRGAANALNSGKGKKKIIGSALAGAGKGAAAGLALGAIGGSMASGRDMKEQKKAIALKRQEDARNRRMELALRINKNVGDNALAKQYARVGVAQAQGPMYHQPVNNYYGGVPQQKPQPQMPNPNMFNYSHQNMQNSQPTAMESIQMAAIINS